MSLTSDAGAKLLKEFRYNNENDVTMRLKGSIVRYRGRPVYVGSTHGSYDILVTDLGTLEDRVIHSSDVDLDISSVPVGWCNSTKGLQYLMRTAKNSQKQGVVPQSLTSFMPLNGGQLDHFHFQGVEQLKPLARMINNDYPSVGQAIFPQGGAFDREWALWNPTWRTNVAYFTLYHKTIPVGTYYSKTRLFFFRKGRLTKVRRHSLESILHNHVNSKEGSYAIQEQL